MDLGTQLGPKLGGKIEPRQDKTGQDRARQDKTRQDKDKDKTRQDFGRERERGDLLRRGGGGVCPTIRGILPRKPPLNCNGYFAILVTFFFSSLFLNSQLKAMG